MAQETQAGTPRASASRPAATPPQAPASASVSPAAGSAASALTGGAEPRVPPQGAADGRRRRGARWIRPGTVVAAGLTMCAAFPPYDLWPLAPVGVAMATLALRGRTVGAAAGLGLLSGLAFFLPVLEGIRLVGVDAWVALGVFEALYFVPLGVGIALVTRLPGWPVWTAAMWVAEELVRDRVPFGGFPWARLAFSQTASPLTPYAAVGGAPLTTFVTALIGGLLAAVVHHLWRTRSGAAPVRWRAPAAALAVVGALLVGGFAVPPAQPGKTITVAVVQGNVPRLGLDFLGQRQAVLNNHVRQTHELAARIRSGQVPRPDLVVWPENASDIDPYQDPAAHSLIQAAVRDVGAPVLVGAVIVNDEAPRLVDDGPRLENRGIVWDPQHGPGAYYVKRHPVPFGEYLPIFRAQLRELIPRFKRVGEFIPGGGPGLLRVGPVTVGDVICFEVVYDEVVRDVAAGDVLVVQTNNATYGRTSLPPQQVAVSRLRAVEHGRPVLVAATSGISAIIGSDGRMLDRSAEFTPDIQVQRVETGVSRTLADHVGAVPEWLLASVGAVAALAAVASGWRRGLPGGGDGKRRKQV